MARKSIVNSLVEKLVPVVDDVSAALKAYTRLKNAEAQTLENMLQQAKENDSLMKMLATPPKAVLPNDNGLAQIFGGDGKQG